MTAYALAIDIGASGGRHMLGSVRDGRLILEEVYRFPNGTAESRGRLRWDIDALWGHILQGMQECKRLGRIPASMGIDTWAVDYVLADHQGRLLGEARGRPFFDVVMEVHRWLALPIERPELPELLGIADRVYVIHEGKLAGEFSGEEITQKNIVKSAIGE